MNNASVLPLSGAPAHAETPAFRTRLRTLRLQRFLTQENLAKRSGLSRTTIRRLEAGEVRPRIHTVTVLARGLEVAPDDLVPDPAQFWAGENAGE
jgi:transcriptional regulator with XRE-family HTH domain